MKAVQIKKYGGSEVIEIVDDALKPTASKGQVQIEVHAASVNPFDNMVRSGYVAKMMPLEFPATLGMDVAGVIAGVGEGVSEFKPGDEVYGQAKFFAGQGAFAEFAISDAKSISLKPKNAAFTEAAGLPLTAVSAYQVLVTKMNLSKGQKILIHGGAGGIGSLAIQMAKNLGAYVTATAGASETDFVKELGADEIIDYKSDKFEDVVSNYDAVFDTVGGDTYKRSFKVLKPGGVIVSMLEQPNQELLKQHSVNALYQQTKMNSADLAKVAELVEGGVLKVHIDRVFPLSETAKAMDYLRTGHPKGKVIIEVQK